jgi:multiple sugar transport system permease protein
MAHGSTALPVMVACITWYSIGWQVIVILGGMASIDSSVFEAARLDGAGFWHRTFRIVLPMLVSTLTYCVVMSVVWTFTGLFSLIYSMTGGGPGYETMTLDYIIYEKSFVSGSQMGMACAVSVLLLVIVMLITAAEMKLSSIAEREWG